MQVLFHALNFWNIVKHVLNAKILCKHPLEAGWMERSGIGIFSQGQIVESVAD